MIDFGLLMQRSEVALVLTNLGLDFERRSNKNGHELYFACPTDNHAEDRHKKRISIAESGKFKGLFNCWACNFKGNLVHLISHCMNISFPQAIDVLQERFGSANVDGTDALVLKLKIAKPQIEDDKPIEYFDLPDDYKLITKCHDNQSIAAREWLTTERHITPEYMDKFEIGCTMSQSIGYAIVIPIKFRGQLRSVFYAQPKKGGAKRYPKNSPQGEILFNYDSCLEARSYIMVESILDAIKIESLTLGSVHPMACFTNMISDQQLRLLKDFDNHGIMPDLDGLRGWDLVDRMIPTVGKAAWIYMCPIGKDPGDCTPEELFHAIDFGTRYCHYESDQLAGPLTVTRHKVTQVKK